MRTPFDTGFARVTRPTDHVALRRLAAFALTQARADGIRPANATYSAAIIDATNIDAKAVAGLLIEHAMEFAPEAQS